MARQIRRTKKGARSARRRAAAPRDRRSPAPRQQPTTLVSRVAALARNLRWSWDPQTASLFMALEPRLWAAHGHNPLAVLANLSPERVTQLAADDAFMQRLDDCERSLDQYLKQKPWFKQAYSGSRLGIAYFCAEFALHESFPQYSGGLGVLAGDHLKSASDLGIPLVGVGLLYRRGYYTQQFTPDGATKALFPGYDFSKLPVTDTGKRIEVPFGRRAIHAAVWQLQVGRVALYLLDTDIPENKPRDREITRSLYGGDNETRIQQEILLGIGGVRALQAVGVAPTVYHLNEGHAAFCALERVRERMASGQDRAAALADVSASTVFTTHTPVPAGHDRFDPKLTMKYLKPLADELGLDRRKFLDLGRENPGQAQDPFCMTVLALNLSDHRNGVSALHGEVSREMWQHVEAANKPDDVAIGHVTNGVHTQTWLAPEAYPLYQKFLKPKWDHPEDIGNWFQKADKIEPAEFWALRNTLRAKLVQFIRERLREQIQRRVGDLDNLMMTYDTFDEAALTIGFARRFATYKRAPLIFRDAKRLQAILGDHQRPVQLVFAGKAHPADKAGQSFAQEIFRHTRAAGFRGRVVLLENYDMHIGRMLTSGCDVWLNNPERPREASGTSGMKPPLHGGLNCSILDGWWPEAFNKRNGWAINPESKGRTQRARDRIDAESIYELLENEIVPTFYNRNRHGIPMQWVKMMKNSLKTVGADFSTHRMLTDYLEEYYLPAHTGE